MTRKRSIHDDGAVEPQEVESTTSTGRRKRSIYGNQDRETTAGHQGDGIREGLYSGLRAKFAPAPEGNTTNGGHSSNGGEKASVSEQVTPPEGDAQDDPKILQASIMGMAQDKISQAGILDWNILDREMSEEELYQLGSDVVDTAFEGANKLQKTVASFRVAKTAAGLGLPKATTLFPKIPFKFKAVLIKPINSAKKTLFWTGELAYNIGSGRAFYNAAANKVVTPTLEPAVKALQEYTELVAKGEAYLMRSTEGLEVLGDVVTANRKLKNEALNKASVSLVEYAKGIGFNPKTEEGLAAAASSLKGLDLVKGSEDLIGAVNNTLTRSEKLLLDGGEKFISNPKLWVAEKGASIVKRAGNVGSVTTNLFINKEAREIFKNMATEFNDEIAKAAAETVEGGAKVATEALEVAGKEALEVAGKEALEVAGKKIAVKVGEKVALKTVAKVAGKVVGKGVLAFFRGIPLVGAVVELGYVGAMAGYKAYKGDETWKDELLTGLATVPAAFVGFGAAEGARLIATNTYAKGASTSIIQDAGTLAVMGYNAVTGSGQPQAPQPVQEPAQEIEVVEKHVQQPKVSEKYAKLGLKEVEFDQETQSFFDQLFAMQGETAKDTELTNRAGRSMAHTI